MKTAPKVSVLIPAYNYAHLLDDAIKSVLNQTFEDFELIIVDNCSIDNTTQVVSNYFYDARVKYFKNDTNIGLAGNWNRCLEVANGAYIKFLCADDKLHPTILEHYVQLMEANPDVSIVTCNKQEFTEKGMTDKIWIAPFVGVVKGSEVIKYIISSDKNIIGSPTRVMFRSQNLVVGKFGNYNFITDLEMWIRHLCVGDCYFVNEILAFGRIHNWQQQVFSKKYSEDRIEYYYFYKRLLNGKYAIDFNEISPQLIHKSIKRIAIKCTFCFYKHLPNISSKSYHKSIYTLFKIGVREKVLLSTQMVKYLKGGTNHKLPSVKSKMKLENNLVINK